MSNQNLFILSMAIVMILAIPFVIFVDSGTWYSFVGTICIVSIPYFIKTKFAKPNDQDK